MMGMTLAGFPPKKIEEDFRFFVSKTKEDHEDWGIPYIYKCIHKI
jgi:hypothetical protein